MSRHAVLLAALIVSAAHVCAQEPPPLQTGAAAADSRVQRLPPPAARLEGTAWTVVEIAGTAVAADAGPADRQPHLVFGTDGRLSGSDGCNRLAGPYTTKANALTFGTLAGTLMACPTGGEVADRLRSVLKGTSHWSLVNGRLELYGATGKPLAVLAPRSAAAPQGQGSLQGTSWQLVRFQGGDDSTLTPDDPARYTIAFGADGRLAARIDCNRGTATWSATPANQLELGPLALTRMMCPPAPLSDHLARQWPFIRSFVLKDGHLFLSLMADGGIYEFAPARVP